MVVTFQELKNWLALRMFAQHVFRYGEARLIASRTGAIPRPLLTATLLALLGRGTAYFEDELGARRTITLVGLARMLKQAAGDFWRKPELLRQVSDEVEDLARAGDSRLEGSPLNLSAPPVYLRTDFVFGLRSGGSVAHIAGVLNHLDQFTGRPIFLTTDPIPTVRADLEVHTIRPGEEFWDFPELPVLHFNEVFVQSARAALAGRSPAFVYQRYSLDNYSGVRLARSCRVPFVLEYNGSELWVSRHWGTPLQYEALCERIELLNLRAADVVVVVSRPMKEDLLARGIDAGKILVNPNGVDAAHYSPEISGAGVRRQYDLNGLTVIGFIGTFGRWHGAEVLAEAFGRLLRDFPGWRARARLLMIGDGGTMPQVKAILAGYGVTEACVLTGAIPQQAGPAHLAACDVLVSPHVPNPDGTTFFGSPTKLFEYMAMGKGIVASDLGQIGEVLEHDRTGWLVTPGDADSLTIGLNTLLDDPARRARLGQAARRAVVARHTWTEHTRRIIEKLQERCA